MERIRLRRLIVGRVLSLSEFGSLAQWSCFGRRNALSTQLHSTAHLLGPSVSSSSSLLSLPPPLYQSKFSTLHCQYRLQAMSSPPVSPPPPGQVDYAPKRPLPPIPEILNEVSMGDSHTNPHHHPTNQPSSQVEDSAHSRPYDLHPIRLPNSAPARASESLWDERLAQHMLRHPQRVWFDEVPDSVFEHLVPRRRPMFRRRLPLKEELFVPDNDEGKEEEVKAESDEDEAEEHNAEDEDEGAESTTSRISLSSDTVLYYPDGSTVDENALTEDSSFSIQRDGDKKVLVFTKPHDEHLSSDDADGSTDEEDLPYDRFPPHPLPLYFDVEGHPISLPPVGPNVFHFVQHYEHSHTAGSLCSTCTERGSEIAVAVPQTPLYDADDEDEAGDEQAEDEFEEVELAETAVASKSSSVTPEGPVGVNTDNGPEDFSWLVALATEVVRRGEAEAANASSSEEQH